MLSGRVATAVFAVAIAFSAFLGVHCFVLAQRAFDRPFPGFFLYPGGAVASLLRKDWDGPRAGLRPRDVVREVGGRPVRSGGEAANALAATPGSDVAIVVEHPDRTRETITLRKTRLHWVDIAFTFALPWCIGWIYLAIGGVIFFVKRTPVGAIVSALCLVAAQFYLTTFDAHTTYTWSRVWISFPLLGPLSLHLFALFP